MDNHIRGHILASLFMVLTGLFLLSQGWKDLGGFLLTVGAVGFLLYLIYDKNLDEDKND